MDKSLQSKISNLFNPKTEVSSMGRQVDWMASPLGHPDVWPELLRSTFRLMQASTEPMFLAWGPSLIFLYNDAYIPILGKKKENSFGQPFAQLWADVWPIIRPFIDETLAGKPVKKDILELVTERNGRPEEAAFSFSYTPLSDEEDVVHGFLCIVRETTEQVRAEKEQRYKLQLADQLNELSSPIEIMVAASKLLGELLDVGRVGYADIDLENNTVHVERDWTNGQFSSLAGETRPLLSFGPAIIDELVAGRTLCLPDIGGDPRSAPYAQAYESIGTRSLIVVPIFKHKRLNAVLYVHNPLSRSWTLFECTFAEEVAHRTWDAVQRARTEVDLQVNLTALEELNQIGQIVHSELKLEPLLQAAADAAVRVTGAQFGAFFYNSIDSQGEIYSLYTISGVPIENFSKFPMPRNTQIFAPTFEGKGVKRSANITLDPAYGKNHPRKGMPEGHLPVTSYLAVPVSSRSGEVFGGIFLGHADENRFTELHEYLVQGIATQAAIGIGNSLLYESRDKLLKAEQEARAAVQLESRLKDEFLNTLSHELRTPLNAITGWAELLQMQFSDEPQLEKGLSVIHRNAVAQEVIIRDLLDMSRITSGKVSLDLHPVELKSAIEDALESVKLDYEAKGIVLETTVADDIPLVLGDAHRLQQVIWNLLTNAVKFTPEHGVITLSLHQLTENSVEISVKDTGCGIDPDFLPHVFDRFRQADGSVARKYGGLGLGLSIVKSLVELHGGQVTAESKGESHGSLFKVILPIAEVYTNPTGINLESKAAAFVPLGSSFALDSFSGCKILVVDNEPDALDLLENILTPTKAVVLKAFSADQALDQIKNDPPDFLISDIGMPDKDGYTLIQEVRSFENAIARRRLPSIALTAFARDEDVERAVKAGFDLHLAKPFSSASVYTKLVQLKDAFLTNNSDR